MSTSWITSCAGIAVLAVVVALDVEADHVVAFGEQTFGPAAEAAEQVDRQRLPYHAIATLLPFLYRISDPTGGRTSGR